MKEQSKDIEYLGASWLCLVCYKQLNNYINYYVQVDDVTATK